MSILSDREILEALDNGEIVIDPPLFDPRIAAVGLATKPFLQPASIDLHLGPNFGWLETGIIDRYDTVNPRGPVVKWDTPDPKAGYWLYPQQFVLCGTQESISLPSGDLVGVLCGKSTLARDGLQVEAAGLADPGWSGNLTLEILNMGPATNVLRVGQPICQIYFMRTAKKVARPYGHPKLMSHYQGATKAEAGYAPPKPAETPPHRPG